MKWMQEFKKNTLVGKYACKRPLGRPHINGRTIMRYTLKIVCRCELDSAGVGDGPVASS
jgi:hypothetical protein